MNYFFKVLCTSGFILHSIIWNSSFAADAKQSYAIKGAGAVSCERYVSAMNKQSNEYIAFSGWIDGYITAFNQFQPETFDIAPWQSTLLLTRALGRHCKNNPQERFFKALTTMLQALYAKRLQHLSEVAKITSNDKALLIYKAVIKEVQTSLNKHNGSNIKVNGIFSSDTESELRRFQKQNKISQTGIPDQNTLQLLFR